MRVLSFSSSFPSSAHPTHGIFVFHRLAEMAKRMPLEVVHPVPSFPFVGLLHRQSSLVGQETIRALTVYHRSFPYVPGLFKRFDGRFYAAGLHRWVREYCLHHQPDLLDAHFAWPDGVGVSYLAQRLGLPYAITLRGTIIPRYKIPCFRRRMAEALRGAAAVISVSGEMARIAVELGTPAERVHVVPNGVDAEFFRPLAREEARRQLGLDTSGRLILCVASLKPAKGHENLLAAMALVRDQAARLVIVGGEPAWSHYLSRLRGIVEAGGLSSRVAFAGVQSQERVATYFSAADISVLPSHNEGCPNVVLESLACGTPVVATTVGTIPDLVQPRQTGELVPVNDVPRLADAISSALERPWSREQIRQTVASRTWSRVAEEVLSILDAAIGRLPSSSRRGR